MQTDSNFIGALLEIDPSSGRITRMAVCCQNSDQEKRITDIMARITRPRFWAWLHRLIGGAMAAGGGR